MIHPKLGGFFHTIQTFFSMNLTIIDLENILLVNLRRFYNPNLSSFLLQREQIGLG